MNQFGIFDVMNAINEIIKILEIYEKKKIIQATAHKI